MRLILFDCDSPKRMNFYPIALSRPIWELRVGMSSLADKLVAKIGATDVAYFVPEYMAESYRTKTGRKVNDLSTLAGENLMLVNPRLRAAGLDVAGDGASQVGVDADGEVLWARVAAEDAGKLKADSIEAVLARAVEKLPNIACELPTWDYTWDLILANSEQLATDFAAAGRCGVEGTVEQPNALRGNEKDIYIAPSAAIHPMVVLDAENGPIYIDEGAEVHPFTRIEGPCYIGRKSILFGAKCREGMSIGPVCRVGGEVEESIIHGYSNKYHDGFLGHAYVGEWVNLGALTTNSDLKNDYSDVTIVLDGKATVNTGSTKVGSIIGDHTKTSIGVLFNTGSYVGAMAMILGTGRPLPKFIPSFAWFMEGAVTKGYGKGQLYTTAGRSMSRRQCEWTSAEEAMWDAIYEKTSPQRDAAVRRGRLQLLKK